MFLASILEKLSSELVTYDKKLQVSANRVSEHLSLRPLSDLSDVDTLPRKPPKDRISVYQHHITRGFPFAETTTCPTAVLFRNLYLRRSLVRTQPAGISDNCIESRRKWNPRRSTVDEFSQERQVTPKRIPLLRNKNAATSSSVKFRHCLNGSHLPVTRPLRRIGRCP